jgi:hypothetical protein
LATIDRRHDDADVVRACVYGAEIGEVASLQTRLDCHPTLGRVVPPVNSKTATDRDRVRHLPLEGLTFGGRGV